MKRSAPMKRTPFKRKEPSFSRPEHPRAEWMPPTVKPLHQGTYAGALGQAAPKRAKAPKSRTAEMIHKGRLAAMGCMVCRRVHPGLPPGPVELHHLRGGGWGKGDYTTLIPLCAEHHRGATGIHGLGTKGFPKRYGFDQADLLADVKRLLLLSKEDA